MRKTKTTKQPATKNRKTPPVPLLLQTMGSMALYDGNEPHELESVVPMMPGLMQAVRQRRMDEGKNQGVTSVDEIVERAFQASMDRATAGDEAKYWQTRHERFMAAVGPLDLGDGLYGDEYLDELRHHWGEMGLFTGMAFAYYFLVEAGVLTPSAPIE